MHYHSMGGDKPSKTLGKFIQISVHGELVPDRNVFTGQKQCISRRTQGKLPYAKMFDVSSLRWPDRTSRSTQTGPKTTVDPLPHPVSSHPPPDVPKILYNGTPTPVHCEALDMVPEVNYWKFDFNTVARMVPVETPLNTPKARSR